MQCIVRLRVHNALYLYRADWFKEAQAALKRYQDERVLQEDIEWSKAREKWVKEAESELKSIKEVFGKNNDKAFLK